MKSAPRPAGAWRVRAACPGDPRPITPPRRPAASGNPPTAASDLEADLRRSADLVDRLDRRRAVRPQRRLRRLRRGQHPRQRRRRATASTSPPTPARPGSTSGSRSARSARWSCTRRTPTSPTPPCSATRSDPTRSAASTAPPTAARPGSRCSSKDDKTGASMSPSTQTTRGSCSPALWQTRRTPGNWTSGGPGSGLYVSRDGGDTWKRRSTGNGLPDCRGHLGQGRRRGRAV